MPFGPHVSGKGVFSWINPAPLRTATRSSRRLSKRVVVLIDSGVKVFSKYCGRSAMTEALYSYMLNMLRYGVIRRKKAAGLRTFADRATACCIVKRTDGSASSKNKLQHLPHQAMQHKMKQTHPQITKYAYDTSKVTYIKPETRRVEEYIHEQYARALALHIYCLKTHPFPIIFTLQYVYNIEIWRGYARCFPYAWWMLLQSLGVTLKLRGSY